MAIDAAAGSGWSPWEGVAHADTVAIAVKTSTSGAKQGCLVLYPETAGDIRTDVVQISGDATAAAYVECEVGNDVYWGVGIDANIVSASLKAIISAINRSARNANA